MQVRSGTWADRLPEALALAHRARSIMRVNVTASLVSKALFVVLAPLGLVTLVLGVAVAVAVAMGMALAVTLKAIRLLRTTDTATAVHLDESCEHACGA